MSRKAPSVDDLGSLIATAAKGVLSEALIRARAERLSFCLYMVRLNELPRAQHNKKAGGRRDELHAIATLAGKLYDKIGAAKCDTLTAVANAKRCKHPLQLTDDLLSLVDACCVALDQEDEDAAPLPGARVKASAASAADLLLHAYEATTSEKATIRTRDGTAYGPFLKFLAAGFRIAGIAASAEAQGRAAIARRKKRDGPLEIRTQMATIRQAPKEKTSAQ